MLIFLQEHIRVMQIMFFQINTCKTQYDSMPLKLETTLNITIHYCGGCNVGSVLPFCGTIHILRLFHQNMVSRALICGDEYQLHNYVNVRYLVNIIHK